jgi:hypothetical protein
MPIRRSAETTSDLFSERAPEPLAKANPAAQPRHFLPKDLAGALKRLDNAEIDALVLAVTTEAERRGRLRPSRAKSADARASAEHLTTGKLNAVRAAFKAGVKPSAIARQFGISQSDIRTALATESRDRKAGR